MKKFGLQYHFELIGNERFRDKIFNEVMRCSKTVADTSELFMRSIQMYNLFQSPLPSAKEDQNLREKRS